MPAGVVFTPIDSTTGERAVPPCSYQESVILEAFLDGTEPVDPCNEEMGEIMDLPWPFQMPYYTAKPGEPMPTFDAVGVADERLRPTPTPDQQAQLEQFEAEQGFDLAEKWRLKQGFRRPEPEPPTGDGE